MPLESLGLPFNPDEPGRKLREVQIEDEPEHEQTAMEKYNHMKQYFYDEGTWSYYYNDVSKVELIRESLASALLSVVEQELGIESTQSQELQEALEEIETRNSTHPILIIHLFPKDPEKARLLWQQRSENTYMYNEEKGFYSNNAQPNQSVPAWENLLIIFNDSLFDAQEALKKLHAFERYSGMHDVTQDSWYDEEDVGQIRCEFVTILIESASDMPQAIRRFERMKKTGAFDTTFSLWRQSLSHQAEFSIEDQLFDILFQMRVEKYQKTHPMISREYHVPEERNF